MKRNSQLEQQKKRAPTGPINLVKYARSTATWNRFGTTSLQFYHLLTSGCFASKLSGKARKVVKLYVENTLFTNGKALRFSCETDRLLKSSSEKKKQCRITINIGQYYCPVKLSGGI
jgi:hypothetical protein